MKSSPTTTTTFFFLNVKYKASIWHYKDLTAAEAFEKDVEHNGFLCLIEGYTEDLYFDLFKSGDTKEWVSNTTEIPGEFINIIGNFIDNN
jgi:hypothetical protein